jgi:hypothetical protein
MTSTQIALFILIVSLAAAIIGLVGWLMDDTPEEQ